MPKPREVAQESEVQSATETTFLEELLTRVFEFVSAHIPLPDHAAQADAETFARYYLKVLEPFLPAMANYEAELRRLVVAVWEQRTVTPEMIGRSYDYSFGPLKIVRLSETLELFVVDDAAAVLVSLRLTPLSTLVMAELLNAKKNFASREKLIELLGLENLPFSSAHNSVRQRLYTLKDNLNELVPGLGEVGIVTIRGEGYALNIPGIESHLRAWLYTQ